MIRRATEDDFDEMDCVQSAAVRAQCAAFYDADLINAWVGTPDPDRYYRGTERGATFYVMVHDDTIVAYGGLNLQERFLVALFVHPDRMGHGLGKRMIDYLFKIAVEEGIERLSVHSSLNAVTFYRQNGFAELGPVKQPCRGGETLDGVLMERDMI